jgi:hypothetical protein
MVRSAAKSERAFNETAGRWIALHRILQAQMCIPRRRAGFTVVVFNSPAA